MLKDITSINNLNNIFEKEILKGVKNKRKINKFEENKMMYLTSMYTDLINNRYNGGYYNLFLIYEPKLRLIMSQNLYNKTINHFVSRFILEPKLTKYLSRCNTATRKNMGTNYAINLLKDNIFKNKKYDEFYFLKMDIKKYFYNIDHEVLKSLLKDKLDPDEYNLLCIIIDSTNKPYINKIINKYNEKGLNIPYYQEGKGLPIGNMTSQFLATFYLEKLHHYIINNLHLKYLCVYMDDYIIIHHDKNYLKDALQKIEKILNLEYKLEINKNKTYIKSSKEGVCFLGYVFKVYNKKLVIKITGDAKRKIKRKVKNNLSFLKKKEISFKKIFASTMTIKNSYLFASKKNMQNIFERYWY